MRRVVAKAGDRRKRRVDALRLLTQLPHFINKGADILKMAVTSHLRKALRVPQPNKVRAAGELLYSAANLHPVFFGVSSEENDGGLILFSVGAFFLPPFSVDIGGVLQTQNASAVSLKFVGYVVLRSLALLQKILQRNLK